MTTEWTTAEIVTMTAMQVELYLQALPSNSRMIQNIIIAPVLCVCGPVCLPGVPVLLVHLVTPYQPVPPAPESGMQ